MILSLVFGVIALYILWLIGKFIVEPYLRYREYRKYGNGNFFPLFGEFLNFYEAGKNHGNESYTLEHRLDNDKNQKIYVTNLRDWVKLELVNPQIIKEFFQKQQFYQKETYSISNVKRLTSDGIIVAEGQRWKTSRRIFSKGFHFDYIQGISSKIENIALKTFQKLIENKQLKNLNMIEIMQEITGTTIILSFFGETLEDCNIRGLKMTQALAFALSSLGEQTFTFEFFLLGHRFFEMGFTKKQREVSSFIKELDQSIAIHLERKIKEIKEEIKTKGKTENTSLLAQLIVSGDIEEISYEQLRQDFANFYLAGMDTTGHLLGMIVYYLSQNKEMYQTLQAEVDKNQDSSPSNLAQLPYMNAVIKEALRFYGPGNIPFDKIATQDHELDGIPIRKGTVVSPYAISIHRSSEFYDDPHSFNPARWLTKKETDLPPFAFIPFSAGQRNCIGQHLAMMEARIILNLFVKTFEFSSDPDYKLKMTFKFLYEPAEPLRINVIPRNDAS